MISCYKKESQSISFSKDIWTKYLFYQFAFKIAFEKIGKKKWMAEMNANRFQSTSQSLAPTKLPENGLSNKEQEYWLGEN